MILREQRQERTNFDAITARLDLSLIADRPEIATIRSLWRTLEQWPQHDLIDAAVPRIITSGWAAWTRRFDGGRRVIFLLLLPGDVITPTIASGSTGCVVEALTRLRCIDATELTTCDLRGDWLAPKAKLLLADADEDYRQRVLDHLAWSNDHDGARGLGRLMLELHDRLDAVGHVCDGRFALPIGQRVLAQALGLSVVQVNKLVGRLRADGLVECGRGWFHILDLHGLRAFTAGRASSRARIAPPFDVTVYESELVS